MRSIAAAAAVALSAALPSSPLSADPLTDARAAFLAAWEAAPLAVSKAVFVTGPAAGYGLYDERGSAAFAPDEPIHIYLEPVGYGFLAEGPLNRFGTEIGLKVRTPAGQELFAQDGFFNLATLSAGKPTEFFGNVTLTLTGLEPGAYVMELILGDLASDETASVTLPIEIAAPAAEAAQPGTAVPAEPAAESAPTPSPADAAAAEPEAEAAPTGEAAAEATDPPAQ